MVPQRCIINCLKMYNISDEVINFIEKNYKNLRSGIDSRREKLNWNQDPNRYIPRRCTITFTIYNCDDATRTHTQKMYSRIQTNYIAGKDKSPNVHGRHQTVCQKWKRIGNSNTRRENLQSGQRNRIWHRKMRHASSEKRKTTHDGRKGTTKSEKNGTLG